MYNFVIDIWITVIPAFLTYYITSDKELAWLVFGGLFVAKWIYNIVKKS